jgi:pimeloyl-ACP methyl ester carboxylesterase
MNISKKIEPKADTQVDIEIQETQHNGFILYHYRPKDTGFRPHDHSRFFFFATGTGLPVHSYKNFLCYLASLGHYIVGYNHRGFCQNTAGSPPEFWHMTADQAYSVIVADYIKIYNHACQILPDLWHSVPSVLMGHSLGSWTSFFAVSQIEQLRQKPEQLVMLDTPWFSIPVYSAIKAKLIAKQCKIQAARLQIFAQSYLGIAKTPSWDTKKIWQIWGHPVAKQVLKRRTLFPTKTDIYTRYENKGMFAKWETENFDQYVQGTFTETLQGWQLNHDPRWEAYFFETTVFHWFLLKKHWKNFKTLPISMVQCTEDIICKPAGRFLLKKYAFSQWATVPFNHFYLQQQSRHAAKLVHRMATKQV